MKKCSWFSEEAPRSLECAEDIDENVRLERRPRGVGHLERWIEEMRRWNELALVRGWWCRWCHRRITTHAFHFRSQGQTTPTSCFLGAMFRGNQQTRFVSFRHFTLRFSLLYLCCIAPAARVISDGSNFFTRLVSFAPLGIADVRSDCFSRCWRAVDSLASLARHRSRDLSLAVNKYPTHCWRRASKLMREMSGATSPRNIFFNTDTRSILAPPNDLL